MISYIDYLSTGNKYTCFGCEACVQICPKQAIYMKEDEERFRYPSIDSTLCIHCNLCHIVCPFNRPSATDGLNIVYGGYHISNLVRGESTSGGAFTAITESFCDKNYVVFGAQSKGLQVFHSYIQDKIELQIFRKSKYSQSIIGDSYQQVRKFLGEGKNVLFSGTPCQISGLKSYLRLCNTETSRLLLVEVICEGVPSPLYLDSMNDFYLRKKNSRLKEIDYRYKDAQPSANPVRGKWDFQVMKNVLQNDQEYKIDRWFNPFWSIWLQHLMSRPSCYKCRYASKNRNADITLGDLWGVHLYCPELYGRNLGCSVILCNTAKGLDCYRKARQYMYDHELDYQTTLKYQSPLRKHISDNPKREEFMQDVKEFPFEKLCKKYWVKPDCKLLLSKYVYDNRQKIALWNISKKI